MTELQTTELQTTNTDTSLCGICHTAANVATRYAQTIAHEDAMSVMCHLNALTNEHARQQKNKEADDNQETKELKDMSHDDHLNELHKTNLITNDDRNMRYDQIRDMMHNRVCPMLPSSMTLASELSSSEAGQRAHATKNICGALCS